MNIMSRRLKQIVYGFVFLAFLAGLIFLISFDFNKKNSKSVEEEETDFEVKIVDDVEIFRLDPERVSFLVQVKNTNLEKTAYFSYRFDIKSGGSVEKEVFGDERLAPSSEEYLIETTSFDGKVSDVEFVVEDGGYKKAVGSIREKLLVKNINTSLEEDRAVVSGSVRNESFVSVPRLELIAVLADEYGFRLSGAKTVLEDIPSFEDRNFEIFVPVNQEVKENVNATSTEVYINLE